MINFFTLLGLPQAAVLDEAALQAAYHEKSRAAHPDKPGGDAQLAAEINSAHEILAAPEKRLKHLLDLHAVPWRAIPISNEMMALFSQLGPQLQNAAALAKKKQQATSALSKALLAPEEMKLREQLEEIGFQIETARTEILDSLPAFDTDLTAHLTDLQVTQATLSYLAKWQAQIREALLVMM